VERMLSTFNFDQVKERVTPLTELDLYNPQNGVDVTLLNKTQQTHYQSVIGSLLYAALTTRPDIAFALNELGRFNAQANKFHLEQAYRVLRYLKGTPNYGLEFTLHGDPTDIKPEIYVDASWGNDLETRRSTTGIVARLNGNVVYWSARKQRTVALSSTEAEYMALSEAVGEALFMRTWINEVFKVEIPVKIYCDNQSAIALGKNDTFHQRTKHIDIRYHFVRENVTSNKIVLEYIPTNQQQANILTKVISQGIVFGRERDRLMTIV
jgi:ribonuclease HI